MSIQFTEENILKLFGNEAAENEGIERLKEYYVKSSVYTQVVGDTPLRILAGHKGIGKSALVKIAIAEDRDKGNLPILVRPDDILGVASSDKSLLELIRDWKEGLTRILAEKVFENLGLPQDSVAKQPQKLTGKFLNVICESIRVVGNNVSLEPAKKALLNRFLKSGKLIVYLDDLDRGWEGSRFDIKRISALLNAVRDMGSDNSGLIFRIALRSDVYFLVRTSDESTDKIEGSVIWYSWFNHEILVLLVKRIETYFGRKADERLLLQKSPRDLGKFLDPIFEPVFTGKGHWERAPIYRVLMSLIRKRPRDLVKLCTAAGREAFNDKSELIRTKHLEAVFEDYSQGRIQDTINEYVTELPDIERLVMGMKPNKKERTAKQGYYFTTDQLLNKITNIIQSGKFVFKSGREADKKDLAQFLYKINFLTARKELENGEIQRKYFEENRYLSGKFVDFGYAWEIHPAYRWALQPDSLQDIFMTLKLSKIEKSRA